MLLQNHLFKPTISGNLPPIPNHPDVPLSAYPYYDQDFSVCKYLYENSYLVFCLQKTCTHSQKHPILQADDPVMYDFFPQQEESLEDIDFVVIDAFIDTNKDKLPFTSTSKGLVISTLSQLSL